MKRAAVFIAVLALLGGPAVAQQGFNTKPGATSKKMAKPSAKAKKAPAPKAGAPVQSNFNRQ